MKQYIMRSAAALVAALCCYNVALAAVESTTVSGIVWHYAVDGDTISIVGADDFEPTIDGATSGGVSVPAKINGTNVVSIGEYAFWGCKNLTGVVLPDSISSIGEGAFFGCSGLKAIRIPSAVDSIGSLAFKGCANLATVYYDNGSLTQTQTCMSDSGFETTGAAFVETVDDGRHTETIDGILWVFVVSGGEVSLEYMDSATKYQFQSCQSGMAAAINMSTAGEIIAPSVVGGRIVRTIGKGAFWKCTQLTTITIQEGVREVDYFAFALCSGLESVSLPESLLCLDDWAFWGCANLSTLTIPNCVTNIGEYAFRECSALLKVEIPEGVSKLNATFASCFGLKSVKLPMSLRMLGENTFNGCSALTKIEIPTGVQNIGVRAFRAAAITAVTLPTSVTNVSSEAFRLCDSLTSVSIPTSVKKVDSYAFAECGSLASVVLEPGVERIEEYAFQRCTNMTSVTIPLSVSYIGRQAFQGCPCGAAVGRGVRSYGWGYYETAELRIVDGCIVTYSTTYGSENDLDLAETAVFPSNVRLIEDGAQGCCGGLSAVSIPAGITALSDGAFRGCTGLVSVTLANTVTNIGNGAFYGCNSLMIFDVDEVSQTYKTENGMLLSKDGKTLVVGVNGDVTIPLEVTKISEYAFYGYSGLTSIVIPQGVMDIENGAFVDCPALKSMTFEGAAPSCSSSLFDGLPFDLVIHANASCEGWNQWNGKSIVFDVGSSSVVQPTVVMCSNLVLTVTNVVVHYVMNSVVPEIAVPVSGSTGFVNVITEVSGGSGVAIPSEWQANYPSFAEKFGSDFGKALMKTTGKRDGMGNPMLVWQDFVAGTDPTNEKDVFSASITVVDGVPVISYTPELTAEQAALRVYKTYGKMKLTDTAWTDITAKTSAERADYNFFKVTVEMK